MIDWFKWIGSALVACGWWQSLCSGWEIGYWTPFNRPPDDIYRHHYSSNDGIRSAQIKHYRWTAVSMPPTELGAVLLSRFRLFSLSRRKLKWIRTDSRERPYVNGVSFNLMQNIKHIFFLLLCPCRWFVQGSRFHKADVRWILSVRNMAKSLIHVNAQWDRMSPSVTTDFLQQIP